MKKVFIDAGAYTGDSIAYFRHYIAQHLMYEMHAFEANPDHWKHFPESDTQVVLHKNAVWIEDRDINFFIGGYDNGIGSTLMDSKVSGEVDYDNPVVAKGIDIDKWIRENFNEDDFIIFKMDIEGGEFEVIPHMIKNGSIKYINELWVEMHPNKVKKYFTHDKDKLIQDIKNCGVKYKDWH